MPRPRSCRRIRFQPKAHYFKPQGIPLRSLEVVELSLEEAEAIRLKHVLGLEQIECARRMNTSQSTFQRILSSASKKIATAIIQGQAIKIVTGK
ncbi:MAG TPA: DUF134 domain-containing protein [Candidatus Pacearchaeota archaeon]|nr:DUF134 domain-containing protein [Candidatus Pacearchaeota archaeon]